jgi:hypothetical protein
MRESIYSHIKLEHFLCALILLSRLGDIGSTYLVTPKLKLEANPIAKRLGWWFALATLLICLVPYYSTALAIVVLVPSLMVSAANTSKIWFVRTYGESEYYNLIVALARKSRLSHALAPQLVAGGFVAVVGLLLLLLSPNPNEDWGYWFAIGFLLYASVMCLYSSLFIVRLFRKAHQSEEQNTFVANEEDEPLAQQDHPL